MHVDDSADDSVILGKFLIHAPFTKLKILANISEAVLNLPNLSNAFKYDDG